MLTRFATPRTNLPSGLLQDLEKQKRTKYKLNGTAATTAILVEKSNPIRPAKSRLPYEYEYSYQVGEHEHQVRGNYSGTTVQRIVGLVPARTAATALTYRTVLVRVVLLTVRYSYSYLRLHDYGTIRTIESNINMQGLNCCGLLRSYPTQLVVLRSPSDECRFATVLYSTGTVL